MIPEKDIKSLVFQINFPNNVLPWWIWENVNGEFKKENLNVNSELLDVTVD